MKKSYDAFLSYASENEKMAAEIVGALKSKGLSIWYAPLQLLPGDGLLQSIRQGMELSKCGILLISEIYLNKKWPVFEINELLNGYIGGKKKIIPIYKKELSEHLFKCYPVLADILSINANDQFSQICESITVSITKEAKTILVTPDYEDPAFNFLNYSGEMLVNTDEGPATTLWEFLLWANEENYPIFMEGSIYYKEDLVSSAAQVLPHRKEEILRFINQEQFNLIWNMCKEYGVDPALYQ